MSIELRHLRALAALADHRTHADAAAALGVSQPTLTRTVHQLERLCGERLIEARASALTGKGHEVLARARRIIAESDALIADLEDVQRVTFGFAWLLPDRWFATTRAEVEAGGDVSIDVRRVDDPMSALGEGVVDVALYRNRPHHLPRSTVTRQVGVEQRVLALSRGDDLAGMTRVSWHYLPVRPLVVNTLSGSTAADSMPTDGHDRPVIACRNFDEWLELVAAGKGMGIVPELAARRVTHPGVDFLAIEDAPPISVRLAWREEPAPIRAVRAFLDAAVTHRQLLATDPTRHEVGRPPPSSQ